MKLNKIVLNQKRKPWYLRLVGDAIGDGKHARGRCRPRGWRRKRRAARKRQRQARKQARRIH